MLVTFVIDTSASMNQTTSSGMTLLDYAKSAVERFVKRVRDPSRRYQHHFMLVSCGCDNATANAKARAAATADGNAPPPWNGRVRVGWDQSTNKDVFLTELKNLQATELSDVGGSLKQAFELLNQIRLQFNWDNYGLGRSPWNTNVAVCVLLTDAMTLSTMDGMIQDALTIPPSNAVGADLTQEPFRWDQRLFTIALKLSATMNGSVRSQPSIPTDLMALSEATGGMLYLPTSKPAVEQSIDQIISKLKPGAVVKFRCDVNEGESEFPTSRNTISPVPTGKEYSWPIAESFWLDRNSVSLPSREAHPVLVYRRTVEGAIEAATNHMLLDTLKFPADNYVVETSLVPAPPRGQRWLVYVQNSRGDGRLGDPIGFVRANPSGGSSSGTVLVLLPYNFPLLFALLVEAARVYQASGQSINSTTGTWMFQAKAMPSAWRESFSAYLGGVPLYYYAPLKKALRKYNLHDMVPEVQDLGRSYQISNFLNRLREQSITESEANSKINSRANRIDASALPRSAGLPESSPSASPMPNKDSSNSSTDPIVDAVSSMSFQDLLQIHQKSSRSFFTAQPFRQIAPLPTMHVSSLASYAEDNTLKFGPSSRVHEEDDKHQQPIDSMSDYESRLIKKEALRNPLGDPEPDEDTPAGLRRRQLCFNLGNPYKKNASKQVSNVYQGEAADEAAALGGQSPKRQRTRKRPSQLKRDKKQAKRSHRPPSSPSFSSSPGSPSRSPTSVSSGSPVTSSPVYSESGESVMTDSSVGSNYSVKAETAQLLGVPLRDGEATEDGQDKSFVSVVYGVLVENWEAWSNILRLIKARATSRQEEEFIMNALRSMKGGDVVVQTYISQAIKYAQDFKKQELIKQLETLQKQLVSSEDVSLLVKA
ncbi:hypothetical protein Poli38472_000850 [Pythium oligandrum]|uniref:Integrator complex subunit 6-like beta-barrel domain-containing protein n=1 Tax=Pythium oligandrum TaxID=41045 RepID=A0A8K1FJJ8_PYTOL|nr:hypothetical protein Poli38472_000850 [Pythium oligandrum]|eukprot:TMW60808.1 hypothetical protein Poli38472_000850 [Pythium oligandrum]